MPLNKKINERKERYAQIVLKPDVDINVRKKMERIHSIEYQTQK